MQPRTKWIVTVFIGLLLVGVAGRLHDTAGPSPVKEIYHPPFLTTDDANKNGVLEYWSNGALPIQYPITPSLQFRTRHVPAVPACRAEVK
jgi:hypothetical protein